MTATPSPAMRAMIQARTTLFLDAPFWGALALRLRLVEDPSHDTAWTDGQSIGFNPAFILSLSPAERLGVLAHEVGHCMAGHPWRRGAREHGTWNAACDYAINPVLAEAGFTLPGETLRDPAYDGHSAEWIYDRLPQPQPQPQPQNGDGEGDGEGDVDVDVDAKPYSGAGEVRDAPQDADAPTREDWQQATDDARRTSEQRGTMPGGTRRFARDATAPVVDWRGILHRFAEQAARTDYTWSRPNVRHMARGMYLPALHSVQVGRVVFAGDVSGSIDETTYAAMRAVLQEILDTVRPASIDVILCDTDVRWTGTFEPGDAVKLETIAGGGTDFRPVFDHVAASGDDPPACMVFLTDLYGAFPETAPEYPVLWAATTDAAAPWGEIVRLPR